MGTSPTNPNRVVKVAQLNRFKGNLDALFQTKALSEAISGLNASTVEGALAELLGKITSLPSAIIPKGTRSFSQLDPSTDLVEGCLGFMWNISDAFVTTSDFVEGAGHNIPKGANVYVANPSTGVYKYDVFQGDIDLSGYKPKQTAVTDPSASGTALEFISSISQDENGVITPLKKTVADVVASESGQGGSHGLMTAAQAEKLAALPTNSELQTALGGKADKDTDAVEGHIAEFDDNGNPIDSGHALSEYKTKQSAVTDPSADGSGVTFIDSITQDTNGVITPHKKSVQNASGSQAGLMSAAHYSKLDAIEYATDEDIDEMFDDSSSD